MGRAILEITPDVLVEISKKRSPQLFEVVDFPLPEDARCVDVRYIASGNRIAIEVESAEFNDAPHAVRLPVLPAPVFRHVAAACEERTGDETI